MELVTRALTALARGIVRLWRYWMMDIGKRKSFAGKAASIGIGLFAICCVCSVGLSMVRSTGQAIGLVATNTPTVPPTMTPRPTATPEPTAIPPTDTPAPTNAPGPTNAPALTSALTPTPQHDDYHSHSPEDRRPTNTPAPTSTPQPRQLAPSCTDLMVSKQRMTHVQWKNYKESVNETWLENLPVTVRDVGNRSILVGGYPVYLEVSGDCDVFYVAPDEQTALKFTKGQRISLTGQVRFISDSLFGGITYHMVHFTVEFR